MSAVILRGDARNLPLPDESVDLIVTSPPYFGLRAYTDGGEQYDGQIGAEATPAEYVAALLDCTREWMRILKPTGSLWVNLGDKYAQRPGQFGPQGETGQRATRSQAASYADAPARRDPQYGVAPKSLLGLPWRYALGAVDYLGLILRAEVIWSKPNGLPESVTDRVRRSHEQWFHLVKSPRYFSAVDEIREAHAPETAARYAAGYKPPKRTVGELGLSDRGVFDGQPKTPNPLGKLPGSVWEIATQPLRVPAELEVDHFAAFPLEWPRRIILGWSPAGICTACGEGRRPVASASRTPRPTNGPLRGGRNRTVRDGHPGVSDNFMRITTITGYACACPEPAAPSRPAVVVDPFGGTGTTALVADVLGRRGISVDRSADYCRLARWRTADSGERARALGVPKPPKQMDGQTDLFDDLGGAA